MRQPEPGRRRFPLTVPGERQLAPLTGAFSLFGFFWGSWAVSTLEIQRALHVSAGGLGLVLSSAMAGAAVANAAGGSLTERWGTSRVLSFAFLIWAGLILATAAVDQPGLFGLGLVTTVAIGGLLDVAMNVAATASLSDQPGFLIRFHARFNGGAAAGAALAGGVIGAGLNWRLNWVITGACAVLVAWSCRGAALPAAGGGDSVRLRDVFGLLRTDALLALAMAFAAGATVEGGVELWGVLYLRTRLESGLLVGAGGAVCAYLVAMTARVLLGPRAGAAGPAAGVLVGAGAASFGCIVMGVARYPFLAALGLVMAAGGISMCWPLLLAEAGAGRSRPGPVVGAVSTVGYLGLVSGPAVVGLVTQWAGLRVGLLSLGGAAVFVALVPSLRRRHLRLAAS